MVLLFGRKVELFVIEHTLLHDLILIINSVLQNLFGMPNGIISGHPLGLCTKPHVHLPPSCPSK